MLTRLDHLVILVRDLEVASADYERLGFAVTPGGEHADGLTRNALVPFEDGTYFELVSFLDPEDPTDNVWGWRGFYLQEGLIDYCAASDDLDSDVRRLESLGFVVDGPDDGGRRLPDGTDIRWRSARIHQENRIFPFLIEDLTPRELRVPGGPATRHPNEQPASPTSRSPLPTRMRQRPRWPRWPIPQEPPCCSAPAGLRREQRRMEARRDPALRPWSCSAMNRKRRGSSTAFLRTG